VINLALKCDAEGTKQYYILMFWADSKVWNGMLVS